MSARHHHHSPSQRVGAGRQAQSSNVVMAGSSKKRSRHYSTGSDGQTSDSKSLRVRTTDKKHKPSAENFDAQKLPFACPFLKQDPIKFSGRKWRCHKFTFSRIRDVKQHLSRRHERPPYCTRCGETFECPKALAQHIRSQVACTLVDTPTEPEGTISVEQQAQLRRKPTPKQLKDDVAQWVSMFNIVFPNQTQPEAPYDDDFYSFAVFKQFAMAHAPLAFSTFFPEVPEWQREAFAHQIGGGLQAIYSLWTEKLEMYAKFSPEDCSPTLHSNVDTTSFSSPTSTIIADPSTEITYRLGSHGPTALANQQHAIPESNAVQEATRELRKTSAKCTNLISWDPEPYNFNDEFIQGRMWSSEAPHEQYGTGWTI